jgi:topoisomerase-4 subunit B
LTDTPIASTYTEASIKTLSSLEHIRLPPGMYIGRLGNGAHAEDGIYVLLKETIDNCIDEFMMGQGRKIEVEITERSVKVRDYGRGIPLGKLVDCVSIINTGAKYDSETFQKAVGLNGVGQKAVNALSLNYRAQAIREGETKVVEFEQGRLKAQSRLTKTSERNGTLVEFTPDEALFGKDFKFRTEFIEDMLWKYAFLNCGLTLTLNGQRFKSEHGLKDLLTKELSGEPLYPIIHLEGEDIEIALTHGNPTARNTGPSSTASTPPRAAPISRRSAKRSSRRFATTSRRISTPQRCANRSTPPSSCACRNPSSSRRPRRSSA